MVFGCKLKLGCTFRYFVLGGFGEPSVWPFGGVLPADHLVVLC